MLWQLTFVITALPTFALAFFIWSIPEPLRRRGRQNNAGVGSRFVDIVKLWSGHRLFYFSHLAGFACMMMVVVGLISWNAAFLHRAFGWSIGSIGLWLGVSQIIVALSGLSFHGWVVDYLFRRGFLNAHMLYFSLMCALALPFLASAYLASDPYMTIILFSCGYFFLVGYPAVGPSALQITTPPSMRGKASSIYMLVSTLVGALLGPLLIGVLTDYVFAGEEYLGLAMAVFSAAITFIAGVLFWCGSRVMAEAVFDQRGHMGL